MIKELFSSGRLSQYGFVLYQARVELTIPFFPSIRVYSSVLKIRRLY
jgi:hypothetical protein